MVPKSFLLGVYLEKDLITVKPKACHLYKFQYDHFVSPCILWIVMTEETSLARTEMLHDVVELISLHNNK